MQCGSIKILMVLMERNKKYLLFEARCTVADYSEGMECVQVDHSLKQILII
mgnify:CR=1 FL=1